MDHHVSAGDATRQGTRNRRRRMRDLARSRHAAQASVTDRYETPAWLDRSFVLPLTEPESNDVPSQAAGRHDDDPERTPEPEVIPHPDAQALPLSPAEAPATQGSFVRPPSPEIDFGRVVRRADLSRTITRVHWVATGLAGVALVVYLLLPSVVLLSVVIACAVASVAAFALRYRLNHAPVPRVQR
jgi:hypothetical protein